MSADCTRSRQKRRWALGSMLASTACWGLATVMTKRALSELPPIHLLTAQLGASITCLWTLALARGHRATLNRGAWLASLAGILEPGLAYALGVGGLALTSASNASLISTTEPLMVIALAFLLLGARPTLTQLGALVVAIAGVALVGLSDGGGGNATPIGDGLIVGATFFAALYVVVTSRLVLHTSPLLLALGQQTVGFLLASTLLIGTVRLGLEEVAIWPSFRGWILVVASGVFQYALAFWFYLVALRVLPVSTAALFLALIPVFGVGGAVLFLGEPLGPAQLLGSALIVAAVLAAFSQATVRPGAAPKLPSPAGRSTRS